MTAPPGGPYGQNPYGTNPYGQQPQWGGQPPGGPGPYPPGSPYANPYPYQQVPQPGQEFPPGGPTGPYPPGPYPPGAPPPGPPPRGPRSKWPWLILGGIAVLGVVALVVVLVLNLGGTDKSTTATSPATSPAKSPATTSAPTSQPSNAQTATDCTPNVSSGPVPAGNTISAGKLSFPANAAPGWSPVSDDESPNLIGAVGVAQPVPGATDWVMQAEVAVTNFVPSMDVTAQASKLMECTASGPGYLKATPTVGPTKTSSITVDGVKAARVDADIRIAPDPSRGNVKGDSVTIIAVDTKPITIFMGASPIGDAAGAATINQVIAALKVRKK